MLAQNDFSVKSEVSLTPLVVYLSLIIEWEASDGGLPRPEGWTGACCHHSPSYHLGHKQDSSMCSHQTHLTVSIHTTGGDMGCTGVGRGEVNIVATRYYDIVLGITKYC